MSPSTRFRQRLTSSTSRTCGSRCEGKGGSVRRLGLEGEGREEDGAEQRGRQCRGKEGGPEMPTHRGLCDAVAVELAGEVKNAAQVPEDAPRAADNGNPQFQP